MTYRSTDAGNDEREIVARIARGDEHAFAAVYDRHVGVIFGSVLRFTGDREVAAEVVQDAFLTLWRRAAQFDAQIGSLGGWLLAIARNRAIDRARSAARRPPTAPMPSDRPSSDAGRVASDDAIDPETAAEQRWRRAVVHSSVGELGPAEREIILLAYATGLSQSEIAQRTGLPLGTVKSRTRRALAQLRARLSAVPELLDELRPRRGTAEPSRTGINWPAGNR